jgi:glucokinase-like ROK family protein
MTKARTGDQALVREINLSIILNTLRDHSPISRASLATVTGLNKTTVSSLVQQLMDRGFVTPIGAEKPEETGRPGILLALNPRAGRIVGAEIGVDFIAVLVSDFAAETIWRRQEQTGLGTDRAVIIERTLELVRQAIDATRDDGGEVLGLGLGVPGLVDVGSGTMLFGPNLGWHDVPLRQILEAKFGFPIYVDNEANMATLGESYFGVARGAGSVLYVSAGVGLGGGIVVNGSVLTGAAGFGGEVGHMTIVPEGLLCSCGNRGCWETLVSQRAVFRRIGAALAAGAGSSLQTWTRGDLDRLSIPLVVEAAHAGDRVALDALEETAVYLGIGLANLVNALNPEIVVFGGILSLASAFLLPIVQRVIVDRALRWSVESMQVLVSAHGFDACVMGGIATVYHEILSQPLKTVRAVDGARGLGAEINSRSVLS